MSSYLPKSVEAGQPYNSDEYFIRNRADILSAQCVWSQVYICVIDLILQTITVLMVELFMIIASSRLVDDNPDSEKSIVDDGCG